MGQLPHQIPQQRGLAASRWGQQQGTDEPPVPEQPWGHGLRDALLLPGNADHSGGDLFQIGDLPVLHHSGAAKSHPEATPHRKKPLPQCFDGGVAGKFSGDVAQGLQFLRGDDGLQRPLPLRQQHRQTVPRPQTEFLRPSLVRLRQLHGDPPQAAGQDGRRQFIARLTFSSFQGSSLLLLLLQCMTAPTRICQMKKVGVPRFSACRKSLFAPLNKFSELHKSSEN